MNIATQAAPPRTGYQKWQDTIDSAVGNPRWDEWDCEIRMAVNEYNRHLANTPGYVTLDWLYIKAILWVENGPHRHEWRTRPLQIGVQGDPGLDAFLGDEEGGPLIMLPDWKDRLTREAARTIPAYNIRAGIGYLLMKMAQYEYRNIYEHQSLAEVGSEGNRHPKALRIKVKAGDNFEKIAKAQGTTVDVLLRLNPKINPLRLQIGQELQYHKATMQRVITGWRQISASSIKERYNGPGDSNYIRKLNYVLPLVRNRRTISCE